MVDKKKTKKDLKKKVKKKLDKLKKKLPKKQYKKLKKKVIKKVDRTLGSQALSNVANRLQQNIPPLPQIIQDPRQQAKELKERLESGIKKEFKNPIKQFNTMKKKYEEVLKKYENGELEATDLFELYTNTKQFANTAQDYIPTQAEIGSAYRTVKSKLNYFKNWINNNLPVGQLRVPDIPNIRRQPPQEPTPTPTPSPQPPPTPSPSPSPSPSPQPPPPPPTQRPTQSPTLQNIYDNIPSVNLAQSTLAVGALATGGILNRLNTRINRNQRNIQNLERQEATDIIRNVAQQSLGQAVGNTIQQSISNINSNTNNAQNIFNELQTTNPNTINNRNIRTRSVNPLRQRTRETQLRQDIGEKQKKSKFASMVKPKNEQLPTRFKGGKDKEGKDIIEPSRPTQKEMDEAEVEQELGVSMTPLTSQDIREEIRTDRVMTGDFTEPTDTEVLERIQEQQQAQNIADRFNRQREQLNLPQMPNIPQEDIQTRTGEDIMDDLRN